MKHHLGLLGLGLLLLLASCAHEEPRPVLLEKANVLPLQLNDSYKFKKISLFLNLPDQYQVSKSEFISFERQRANWGAITNFDYDQRTGNYFTLHWGTNIRSDVTVRLEYRQAALTNYVQAQEMYYPNAKGTYRTKFQVTGDDYLENGRVTSWRGLLIVDGKIVAVTQSYMWK